MAPNRYPVKLYESISCLVPKRSAGALPGHCYRSCTIPTQSRGLLQLSTIHPSVARVRQSGLVKSRRQYESTKASHREQKNIRNPGASQNANVGLPWEEQRKEYEEREMGNFGQGKAVLGQRGGNSVRILLVLGLAGFFGAGIVTIFYGPPSNLKTVHVKSIEKLTSDTSLIKLELSEEQIALFANHWDSTGPIKSVMVVQPELSITRHYTPLTSKAFEESGPGEISLVVKRYRDGEVSRYLHRLEVGDKLTIIGPVTTWNPPRVPLEQVTFIVGGTGITPAFQYISDTLNKSDKYAKEATPEPIGGTRLQLIYSSNTPSQILLRKEIDDLVEKYPKQLSVIYLVDALDTIPVSTASAPKQSKLSSWLPFSSIELKSNEINPLEETGIAKVGRISRTDIDECVGAPGTTEEKNRRRIVVCGPEGMIVHLAGPRDGRNQSKDGPISGILGNLGYTNEEVVRL